MDKNRLLETARKLEQVNPETAEEWMQVNIRIFVKLSDQDLETPNSLH